MNDNQTNFHINVTYVDVETAETNFIKKVLSLMLVCMMLISTPTDNTYAVQKVNEKDESPKVTIIYDKTKLEKVNDVLNNTRKIFGYTNLFDKSFNILEYADESTEIVTDESIEETQEDSTTIEETEESTEAVTEPLYEFIPTEMNLNQTMYFITRTKVRDIPVIENTNIVTVAEMNESVIVIDRNEDWSRVIYNGEVYFIHTPLLSYNKIIIETEPIITPTEEIIPETTIQETQQQIIETQPVITYRYNPSEYELQVLYRIVEAEITGDDGRWHNGGISNDELFKAKVRVAQNILNRLECPSYPNTIDGVVFQQNQYAPIRDGRYYTVTITNMTIEACNYALLASTPDLTNNAIFFRSDGGFFKYGDYMFTDATGTAYFSSHGCVNHNH